MGIRNFFKKWENKEYNELSKVFESQGIDTSKLSKDDLKKLGAGLKEK